MKRLIFLLFLCFVMVCGCINISQEKTKKADVQQEIKISQNSDWPDFTDKEIEEAKEAAKEYYKNKDLPHDIESIDWSMSNDEKDRVCKGFIGDASKYKNHNYMIFLVRTKDNDGCNQSRLILLKRENEDSSWKVINEGL